jgi:hypothetical protein
MKTEFSNFRKGVPSYFDFVKVGTFFSGEDKI